MVSVDKKVQGDGDNINGADIQSTICMEECAELIQAISKMKRGKDNRDNLIEEMADVLIVLTQLRFIYNVGDEELTKWLHAKQDRQKQLLLEDK